MNLGTTINLRISAEELEALDLLAALGGVSRSAMLRGLVAEKYSASRRRVDRHRVKHGRGKL